MKSQVVFGFLNCRQNLKMVSAANIWWLFKGLKFIEDFNQVIC